MKIAKKSTIFSNKRMRSLVLFLLIFGFFSCDKKERSSLKSAIRISLEEEPSALDPHWARDLYSINLVKMLFEGLVRESSEGKWEWAVAEKGEISEDQTRYTFFLRPCLWSNGELLTAFDFERSWKALLDPNCPSDTAYPLYVLKNGRRAKMGKVSLEEVGVKALREDLLSVELEKATPYFFPLLAMVSFFPVPKERSSLVSNGPFTLKSWEHTNRVSFLKNPKYWNAGKVRVEQLDFIITNPETALELFEQKRLDWIGSPLSNIPVEALSSSMEDVLNQPLTATYFYRINTKKKGLSDAKVRRALFACIDRAAIAEHIMQGNFLPATTFVPPSMGLLTHVKPDLCLAKLPRKSFTLSYINTERNGAISQAVKENWEKSLGIAVHLEALEQKVFFEKVAKGDYEIAAGSWVADFADPVSFLEVFKYRSGSLNHTGWENSYYIDLLDRSQICNNGERRNALLTEAEGVLMEEMPILPIFHYSLHYRKSGKVKGESLSSLGILDLQGAYLEK